MFKKKPQIANPSLVLNPEFGQEGEQEYRPSIEQAFTQPIPQSQQFQQSIATQPTQQFQQPVQQQKPKMNPEAIIIQAFITEDNTFKYVVETNYPLSLGNCSLTQ